MPCCRWPPPRTATGARVSALLHTATNRRHPHTHQLVTRPSFTTQPTPQPLLRHLTRNPCLPTRPSWPPSIRILRPGSKGSTYIRPDPVAVHCTLQPPSSPSRNCPPLNITTCITIITIITPTIILIISQAPCPTNTPTAPFSHHTMTRDDTRRKKKSPTRVQISGNPKI